MLSKNFLLYDSLIIPYKVEFITVVVPPDIIINKFFFILK